MKRYKVVATRLRPNLVRSYSIAVDDLAQAENLAAFIKQDRRDTDVTIFGVYRQGLTQIVLKNWTKMSRGRWKKSRVGGGFEH